MCHGAGKLDALGTVPDFDGTEFDSLVGSWPWHLQVEGLCPAKGDQAMVAEYHVPKERCDILGTKNFLGKGTGCFGYLPELSPGDVVMGWGGSMVRMRPE